MRVLCEFCGNEIDVAGNMTCPHCGGAVGELAKKERERLEKLAEEEKRRQLELDKEREKTEQKRLKAEAAESDNEKWGRILAGSMLGFTPFSGIRRFMRDISGFFKIVGIIAVIVIIVLIFKWLA